MVLFYLNCKCSWGEYTNSLDISCQARKQYCSHKEKMIEVGCYRFATPNEILQLGNDFLKLRT